MCVEKRNGQISPKGVAVEVGELQIVPRALKRLAIERFPWIASTVEGSAAFVLNGNLAWREKKASILTDEVCDQTLEVQAKFDADVFQSIRLAFDLPKGTGFRNACG